MATAAGALRKQRVERIKHFASHVGDQHFGGDVNRGFLCWGTELHLDSIQDPPSQEELVDAITDGTGDLGLDAGYFDDAAKTVYLMQSKFSEATTTIPREEVTDFLGLPGRLVDSAALVNANDAVADFAPRFRKAIVDGYLVQLIYIDSRSASSNVMAEAERWNEDALHIQLGTDAYTVEHNVLISDQGEMLTRFDSAASQISVDVSLRISKGAWYVTDIGGVRIINASLAGDQLADVFEKYRFGIFRYNPRGPLGGVNTNKAIVETLRSTTLQPWFPAYNNGIGAVCSSFVVKDGRPEYDGIEVKDFQIVNGCQTTFNIWDTRRRGTLLREVSVAIKIIEGEHARHAISKASNQQSTVTDWDFIFTAPEQERLQKEFKLLHPTVYYELRRGEYKYIAGTPNAVRIKVKDVAQAAWACLGHPGEAKDRLREIAETRDNASGPYKNVFPPGVDARYLRLLSAVNDGVQRAFDAYTAATGNKADYRAFGRLHVTWLIARHLGIQLGLGSAAGAIAAMKPEIASGLFESIDTWFGNAHSIAVKALDRTVKIEVKAAEKVGQSVQLRQLFRSPSSYHDFAAAQDELIDESPPLGLPSP